ncbi:MAG: hypothetical protein UT55_C0084G0015, partial [Candidatus Peregrinibacteria bacterium GW2011_GWE2_39_6]
LSALVLLLFILILNNDHSNEIKND